MKPSVFRILSQSFSPAKSWEFYFLLARKTVLTSPYIVPKTNNYSINSICGFWFLIVKAKELKNAFTFKQPNYCSLKVSACKPIISVTNFKGLI